MPAIIDDLIIGGVIWGVLKALFGGKSSSSSSDSADAEVVKVKKYPTGAPQTPPAITFNHEDYPSASLQFALLGYSNPDQFTTKKPKGPFVGQFQRDYNSIAAACLNQAFCSETGAKKAEKMGKLSIDNEYGPKTANGLEWAKRIQGLTGETWQSLVSQAHLAGY